MLSSTLFNSICRRKNHNTVGDGDKDIYLQRLQEWQDTKNEADDDLGYDTLYCDTIPNVQTNGVNDTDHDARQNVSVREIVENPYYGSDDVSGAISNQLSTNEDTNTIAIVKTVENPYYSGI